MSDQNHTAQQPIQIHPVAELIETRWQLSVLRLRNLTLANENFELKSRIKQLEAVGETMPAAVKVEAKHGN